ncbi:hypothetical protein EAF04_004410 [Stromatinia cepivora]|nr:hypothetical protein EAF04_004410 [Stromatinia cepivora]
MAEPIENAIEPVEKGTVSEKPVQEAPRLTIENVAQLGFDHELIRFAVFHTNGSIWEAADVLLKFESRPDKGNAVGLLEFALWIAEKDRIKALKILARVSLKSFVVFFNQQLISVPVKFRSGAPAQPEMLGSITSKKSTETRNAETAQKKSSLKKVTNGGESQSKVVGTALQKQLIIEDTVKGVEAALSSRKPPNVWVSREPPASSQPPNPQPHQRFERKTLPWSWKRAINSVACLPAKGTTMPQRQRVSATIDNPDHHTQEASNSSQSQSETVVTTIQAEPIIAEATVSNQIQSKTVATTIKKEPTGEPVIPKAIKTSSGLNIYGSGTKRKLEVIEISDDEVTDVDVHSPSRVKTGNGSGKDGSPEDSAADDGAADDGVADDGTADDNSGAVQTPEIPLQLVNEGVWADKRIAWAEKFFQKSESRIVLGRDAGSSSSTHKVDCFVRVFQRATNLATIRKSLLALESQAYPYSTNCILEGAVASATIELKDACSHCLVTHKWLLNLDEVVVLLISNHPPSKAGLLALETKKVTGNGKFRKSKLCGNKACRRPSHVIGESRSNARPRQICHARRQSILEKGDIPQHKCTTKYRGIDNKHFPACLTHLTLSDEATFDACADHNWRYWKERPVIKVAFGQKLKKKRELVRRIVK